MSVTTTITPTVKTELDKANLNNLADLLKLLLLGTALTNKEYDTGTVTAADTCVLPTEALFIQSARVVTGGATYVGTYMVTDSAGTDLLTASTHTVVGLAKIGTDRKTITFPTSTQATRVIVHYIPLPLSAMSSSPTRS